MASIKVKFRPSTVAEHEGTVYYQVIHERKTRQLLSQYHIFNSEWDAQRSTVASACDTTRESVIHLIQEGIRCDIKRLAGIIHKLEINGQCYTTDDIVNEFRRHSSEHTLFKFMQRIIRTLRRNGKARTSETYTAALSSFRQFRNGHDIMLDSIDSEVMEAYEAWHRQRGNSPNTISFYIRILRAVYNRAVENDIIDNRNPFRHVYTGIEKTAKRALPLSMIRKLRTLDLSHSPSLDYARDMFILSFMLRGMSFVDMAYLRKSDRYDGYITYRRRKTGQRLTIEWTPNMQTILDKYPENRSEYLLPIIKTKNSNERSTYRNASYNINRNLKKIARSLNINTRLTLYVARHSWASAAHTKGIPVSVISEGMGHESETTTQIYLASLDTSTIDRANALILRSLS